MLVKFLLAHGAHAPQYKIYPFQDTLQVVAQDRGYHEIAELLIRYGSEINPVDEEYQSTPLGMAARWGHTEMVKYLFTQGADPNKAGAPWTTPLAWAREKGTLKLKKF